MFEDRELAGARAAGLVGGAREVAAWSERPTLAWQPSLLDLADAHERPTAGLPPGLAGTRHQLDECCWVDHVPAWWGGADELFAELLAGASWTARTVRMWDRVVTEPRLTARWPLPAVPLPLERMRAEVDRAYGAGFDSVGVNLYRDGRDSVSWHGDRIGPLRNPLVATVSLGGDRRFVLRRRGTATSPAAGSGPGLALQLRSGDLVVMGGAVQHDWLHAVPKCSSATARMAVTIRHSRPLPGVVSDPAGTFTS